MVFPGLSTISDFLLLVVFLWSLLGAIAPGSDHEVITEASLQRMMRLVVFTLRCLRVCHCQAALMRSGLFSVS